MRLQLTKIDEADYSVGMYPSPVRPNYGGPAKSWQSMIGHAK